MCTSFDIHLHPLPGSSIWTGDANQSMSYLKATSFLGGLRFWTEALLRAQGQSVHGDDSGICTHGGDKPTCDLCHIFGCTGLGRSFALKIHDATLKRNPTKNLTELIYLSERKYIKDGKEETPRYLRKNAHNTSVKLHFAMQRPVIDPALDGNQWQLSPTLMRAALIMFEYGALGAYDQYGCGFVNFEDKEQLHTLRDMALASPVSIGQKAPSAGARLGDFFFFKGESKTQHTDSKKPDKRPFMIRHDIRNAVREVSDRDVRHWFCGFMPQKGKDEDKGLPSMGTKYNFTITTAGKLYGWGYFPRNPNVNSRDEILNATKEVLEQYCNNLQWKEFDSAGRDTCKSPQSMDTYITDMLKNPWKEARS